MKDNNFSFIKLRDEIIHKSGLGHNIPLKETQKKLKFEPNVNIARQSVPQQVIEKKAEKSETPEQSNLVNLTESNSHI